MTKRFAPKPAPIFNLFSPPGFATTQMPMVTPNNAIPSKDIGVAVHTVGVAGVDCVCLALIIVFFALLAIMLITVFYMVITFTLMKMSGLFFRVGRWRTSATAAPYRLVEPQ